MFVELPIKEGMEDGEDIVLSSDEDSVFVDKDVTGTDGEKEEEKLEEEEGVCVKESVARIEASMKEKEEKEKGEVQEEGSEEGESKSEHPSESWDQVDDAQVAQEVWERHETENGDPFWYNPVTQVSQWLPPDQENLVPEEANKNEHEHQDETYIEAMAFIQRLHTAVKENRAKQVETLVQAGIDVNAADDSAHAPVFYANDPKMLNLLLSLGANIQGEFDPVSGGSYLHHLAASDFALSVQLMQTALDAYWQDDLHKGASDVIFPQVFPAVDHEGNTPLHIAAQVGNLATVKYLSQFYYLAKHATEEDADSVYFVQARNSSGYLPQEMIEDERIVSALDAKLSYVEIDCWRRRALDAEAKVIELQQGLVDSEQSRHHAEVLSMALSRAEQLEQENASIRSERESLQEAWDQERAKNEDLCSQLEKLQEHLSYYENSAPYYAKEDYQLSNAPEHQLENAEEEFHLAEQEPPIEEYEYDTYQYDQPQVDEYPVEAAVGRNGSTGDTETPETEQDVAAYGNSSYATYNQEEGQLEQAEEIKSPLSDMDSAKAERIGKVWATFFQRAAERRTKAVRSDSEEAPLQNPAQNTTKRENTPDFQANNMLVTAIDLIDSIAVQEALEAGAGASDVLDDSREQETMLHRCCTLSFDGDKTQQSRIVHIAAMLIQHGANVDTADNRGVTPLHLASAMGNAPLVQTLVEQGSSVQAIDSNGESALHAAASGGDTKGHLKCCQLLVRFGVNIALRNNQGSSAADCARAQVSLSLHPPRTLQSMANMLEQLVQATGDEPNPFAEQDDTHKMALAQSAEDLPAPPTSSSSSSREEDSKNQTPEPNKYRYVDGSKKFVRKWPDQPTLDTSAPPTDEGEQSGWFSSLVSKVMTASPKSAPPSAQSPHRVPMQMTKPPSEAELKKIIQLEKESKLADAL